MEIRSAYSEKPRVQINCGPISRTKQAHREECDINNIMQKYTKTNIIEHARKHQGEYGFCTSTDFKESLDLINKAQNMFDELPSKARNKFENDPGAFLDYVQDPANQDDLYDLGLAILPPQAPDEIIETLPAPPAAPPPVPPA